jgi:6-phosphogluconolactonase (cycloisomerase 2 family)
MVTIIKALFFLLIFSSIINCNVVAAEQNVDITLVQVLEDGINGVDGLDNPRVAKIANNNSQVVVVSGDDNSFAVFNLDDDFNLTLQQVFKNIYPGVNGLEGASGVTLLSGKAFVTGFYDGALTTFTQRNRLYEFTDTISDKLSDRRLFESDIPVGELDYFGLLGAWEVIGTTDEKQLLVASYLSNSISIFDITLDEKIVFNRSFKNDSSFKEGLGQPVSLGLSPSNDELYVLGFEGNQLTIFDRGETGELAVKQVLKNGINNVNEFLNPQKIAVSSNGKYLYVACSGSNSIVVFAKTAAGSFDFLQAVTNSDLGGSGLNGAGSIAVSANGLYVYAAGENDSGLLLFDINKDGLLQLKNKFLGESKTKKEIGGISSIILFDDDRHLMLTAAKTNSLFVYKIKDRK